MGSFPRTAWGAEKPIIEYWVGFVPSRCCCWNSCGDPGGPAGSSHSAEPDCPGTACGNVLEKALSSGNVPVIWIPIKKKAFVTFWCSLWGGRGPRWLWMGIHLPGKGWNLGCEAAANWKWFLSLHPSPWIWEVDFPKGYIHGMES